MAYKIINIRPQSEEWLTYRKDHIGGSDAGSIIGFNQYKSPLSLWLEKTGEVEPADLSDNAAVRWGLNLEDSVAAEFKGNHPDLRVERMNRIYESVERPFQMATVDRNVTDSQGRRGVLEVKTAHWRRGQDWDEEVPAYYMAQVQHYLSVTGFSFAWVAVLIGGSDYREYYVERDEDFIKVLNERETQFCAMVSSHTMPQLVGTKEESGRLFGMYAEAQAQDIEDVPENSVATSNFAKTVEQICLAKADIKESEGVKRLYENELRARIGDGKGLRTSLDGVYYQATWVRSSVATFDKERFGKDHPDLLEEYTTKTERDMGLRVSMKEIKS